MIFHWRGFFNNIFADFPLNLEEKSDKNGLLWSLKIPPHLEHIRTYVHALSAKANYFLGQCTADYSAVHWMLNWGWMVYFMYKVASGTLGTNNYNHVMRN